MKKYLFIFLLIILILLFGCDNKQIPDKQDTNSVEEDSTGTKEKLTIKVVNNYIENYNAVNMIDILKECKFRYTIEFKRYFEKFYEKPLIFIGTMEDIYEKNKEIYAGFYISINLFDYLQLRVKCSEELTERLLKDGGDDWFDSILSDDYVICAYINSIDRIEFVVMPYNEGKIDLNAGRTVILIGEMVDYTYIGDE